MKKLTIIILLLFVQILIGMPPNEEENDRKFARQLVEQIWTDNQSEKLTHKQMEHVLDILLEIANQKPKSRKMLPFAFRIG